MKNPHIGTSDECEFARMREPYLTTGYRVGYDARACLASVFEWHNETLNIWTHLLGFFACVVLLLRTLRGIKAAGGSRTHTVMSLFFFVPATCSMATSTLFHVFRSVSKGVYATMAPFDFFFIALGLVGIQVSQIYYSLAECPKLRRRFFAALAVASAAAVGYVSVPALVHPRMRVLRTAVFAAASLVALAARVHAVLSPTQCPTAAKRRSATMPPFLTAYALAGAAVVVYLLRWPERYWPATFDNTLQSHILMHVLTMAAEFLFWRIMQDEIRVAIARETASRKKKRT